MGRLVHEQCPDKWLGACVHYGNHLPKRNVLYQNICLWNPFNEIATTFFNPDYRRQSYEQMRSWSRTCDHMFFYTAYHGAGFWSFPYSSTPVLADLFPFLKLAGNQGFHFDGVEGFGGNDLDIYLTCRLAWDATLDSKKLVGDYYEKFYGPQIGPRIRAWHGLLQDAARHVAGDTQMNELGELAAAGGKMIEPIYGGIRQQGRQMLDEALAAAPEGEVKERVKLISESFRLVELTLDALQAYKAVDKDPSQPHAIAFKNAVEAREQFLEAHKDSLAINYAEVRTCDSTYALPVKREVAEHYLALKSAQTGGVQAPSTEGRRFTCESTESWMTPAGRMHRPGRGFCPERPGHSCRNLPPRPGSCMMTSTCIWESHGRDPHPDHLLANATARDGKGMRKTTIGSLYSIRAT